MNPTHAADLAFDLIFGCQTIVTGLFKTQLADGIMGMNSRPETFWAQMFNAGKMGDNKAFALCFARQPTAAREGTESGALTLGGADGRLHESPMVFTSQASKGRSEFFSVKVRRVMLRDGLAGESAQSENVNVNEGVKVLDIAASSLNSGGVIVDSGTTDTYWNRAIASEFNKVFAQVSGGRQHNNNPIALTDEELAALPTILFQLESDAATNPDVTDPFHTVGLAGALDPKNPYDVILAFPPSHYMEYDPSDGKYTSRFYPTEGSGSVLGANAMMGHDVFFDVDNDRIGWAESSCDYTTLVTESGYDFQITGMIKDVQTVGNSGAAPSSDCSSYSSGVKCNKAEGCSWYFGKCSKTNDDAPPEDAPTPTVSPTSIADLDPPGRPPPEGVVDDDDKGIVEDAVEAEKEFLDACSTPACQYPVIFGLVIALITGCCLSYCCIRMRGNSSGNNSERYKYARAPGETVEIELTNGNHDGSQHSHESFKDEPDEELSSENGNGNGGGSVNGSYRDEPEFEGDFA